MSITGPCSVVTSAALTATTCTSTPTCFSTGCSCGTCPIARAQLGSTVAASAATTVVKIVRRGTTYANPAVLHLYPTFSLAADVYPDGSGGAVGTVTLVSTAPVVSCLDKGTGYTTLPSSVVIGQSTTTGTAQASTCTITFSAGVGTSAGKVTCLGGQYNLVFKGGSGTLTPGTCTVLFGGAGTHTSSFSAGGSGYAATQSVVFKTGVQPRGCLATLIGGITVTAGVVDAV